MAVLEAAQEAFAETGFEGTRINDIARRARVNKQRIYAYFGDKERLFVKVQQDALASLAQFEATLVPAIIANPSNIGKILTYGYVRFHEMNPQFRRLMTWSDLGHHEGVTELPARTSILEQMQAAFTKAQSLAAVPSAISFDTWFVVLHFVVFSLFSCHKSMYANLNIDFSCMETRQRLVDEILSLLERRVISEGNSTAK
jgi:AcrR family transcriptional regulator